jgi:hypothetical protein
MDEPIEVAGRGLGLLTGAQFDYRRLDVEAIRNVFEKTDGFARLSAC